MTVPRPISAEKWNSLVRFISTNHIVGFLNQSRVVNRHPWQCRCRWDGAAKQWQVQINPGLVAAQLPELRDASAPKEDWENKTTPPLKPLSDDPWLALPAALHVVPDSVPEYFAKKGVVGPGVTTNELGEISARDLEKIPPQAEQRALKKVDLLLQIPRIAGTLSVDVDGRGIPGVNVGFRQPSGPPLIYAAREYSAPEPLTADDIFEQGQDLDYDLHHLARIWFLSPLGVGVEAKVDATWTPYPEHKIFWNLGHGVKLPEVGFFELEDLAGLVTTGSFLAGGAGANMIQLLGLELERNTALAELLLARVKVVSEVWTV